MARPKGSPNKNVRPLEAKCLELGIDPFEVLLLFAGNKWKELGYKSDMYISSETDKGTTYKPTIDSAVRAKAAAEACQYILPKRKAIELSTDEDKGFRVIIEDYSKKNE